MTIDAYLIISAAVKPTEAEYQASVGSKPKVTGAALRLCLEEDSPGKRLVCGVEIPLSSNVVASVRDSALLGVPMAFLASKAVAASFDSTMALYCSSYSLARFWQNT